MEKSISSPASPPLVCLLCVLPYDQQGSRHTCLNQGVKLYSCVKDLSWMLLIGFLFWTMQANIWMFHLGNKFRKYQTSTWPSYFFQVLLIFLLKLSGDPTCKSCLSLAKLAGYKKGHSVQASSQTKLRGSPLLSIYHLSLWGDEVVWRSNSCH